MTTTKLSMREFDQDTSRAVTATVDGPVIITDQDRPVYVLLTYEDFGHLTRYHDKTDAQSTAMPAAGRDDGELRRIYLRRQAALVRTAARLRGRPPVSEEDRQAVRDAIDAKNEERAVRLGRLVEDPDDGEQPDPEH